MFFQKDNLSKYGFISLWEFILASVLMFLSTVFTCLGIPYGLKKLCPEHSGFFDRHLFGIFIFFLSAVISFFIIYYFSCKRKQKSLKEGLFFYPKSNKVYIYCVLIGLLMPLLTLPIILKFAPKEFYAMDVVKTKDGIIYLLTAALSAPVFEEIYYRGFIFSFFQSKLNSYWAVIITGIYFGFCHLSNIGNAHILLSLFIFYGFVLTLIRYFTNSLIPPIITHFVHNLTLMVSFFIASRV